MKALVIHPWKGVRDSHKEAFRKAIEASLSARGIEPVLLDLEADSSIPYANEELLEKVYELDYGDMILWHGGSFPEVMNLVAYAMRILAPTVGPHGLPLYHFMPYGVLTNLPVEAWSEYNRNESLFGAIINMYQLGKEEVTEEDLVKGLGLE